MAGRLSLLVLTLALLGGCVQHVSPEHPEALLPDRSAQIEPGLTRRSQVHERLGPPLLASDYWGFELFRADTEQAATMLVIAPWPVPFAHIKDRLLRYSLVAYDDEARVVAVDSGLVRRPTDWRSMSPIETDFPALHLRSGDLLFFVVPDGERRENLLAAPALRDAWLERAHGATDCILVLGCGAQGCPDRLALDSQPAQRLPLRLSDAYWYREGEQQAWLRGMLPAAGEVAPSWLDTLVALRLPPGEHRLQFSARHLDGRQFHGLSCRAGEVSYLQIDATAEQGFWHQELVDWRFESSRTMPAAFRRRPLVLMGDGHWFVEER